MFSTLFTPVKLGRHLLKNRIFLPPLTRCRSSQPGNIHNVLMATYYRQRASAGFMVTEGTVIEPRGALLNKSNFCQAAGSDHALS